MIDLVTLLQVVNQVNEAEITITKTGDTTHFTCTIKDGLDLPSFEEELEEEPQVNGECYLDGTPIEPPDAPLSMTY